MSYATQYKLFDCADCHVVRETSVPTSIAVLVIALTASELVILGLCKAIAWYADMAFYSQDWTHEEQTTKGCHRRSPEAISQSLHTRTWERRAQHSAEESTCPICLVEFETGDNVSHGRASCHHVFHTECISQWLSKQSSCPCCRQDMIVPSPAPVALERFSDPGFCLFVF